MNPDKELFEIQVAGLPLKLRSSHDSETVSQLVELVDQKVNEALAQSTNISFQNALLLASLHLAEDLVLLKRAALRELDQLEGRAQHILSDLESSPMTQIGLDN